VVRANGVHGEDSGGLWEGEGLEDGG
jgi:hypothetical protein